MSKERELLNKAIEMIQIAPTFGMYGLKMPPDFGSELILEIQELLAQPEQEPVGYKPIQDYLKSYGEEISYEYEQGFEDGVEWAERQHGIGGGE
jgi:hypothetical protein